MRDIVSILAGIAVGLVWFLLWDYLLRVFGIPMSPRKAEDLTGRRERLKQIGKFRYVLLCGVLGFGFAFGLAMTTADYIWRDSFNWNYELSKLVFLSLFFGLFQGMRNWGEFREPVPFPPNYPPQK